MQHKYIQYARLLAATCFIAFLTGCASMSPGECKVADWYQVGQDDGANGVPPRNQLADYAKDCAKVGILPDTERYRAGWEIGITRFCTPANGWREGSQGRTYKQDACRGRPYEGAFASALQAGLDTYNTRQSIQRNESDIRRLEQLLQDKSQTDKQRAETRSRIRFLDFEQSRLRRLLFEQERMAPR